MCLSGRWGDRRTCRGKRARGLREQRAGACATTPGTQEPCKRGRPQGLWEPGFSVLASFHTGLPHGTRPLVVQGEGPVHRHQHVGAFRKSLSKEPSAVFTRHLLLAGLATNFRRACGWRHMTERRPGRKAPAELPFQSEPRAMNLALRQNLQARWDPRPVSDSGGRVGPNNLHFSRFLR